ncbi:690_t:CDS:2 [Ambispora leptoticha]|uniref:690_t:CDS:1 n=1 Tax=Ambispora leptoticha TaxID=144679 RepID=A0A9N8Z190_9GLOM|nr:690_t:CDS:2 [Ambispora leptoticha]
MSANGSQENFILEQNGKQDAKRVCRKWFNCLSGVLNENSFGHREL